MVDKSHDITILNDLKIAIAMEIQRSLLGDEVLNYMVFSIFYTLDEI